MDSYKNWQYFVLEMEELARNPVFEGNMSV